MDKQGKITFRPKKEAWDVARKKSGIENGSKLLNFLIEQYVAGSSGTPQEAPKVVVKDKIPAKGPEKAENPAKTSEKPIVNDLTKPEVVGRQYNPMENQRWKNKMGIK